MMEPSMVMVVAVLAFAALALWLTVLILQKAGLSGWWCLATLVPVVNLVMVWVFAYTRWPALESGGDAAFDVSVVRRLSALDELRDAGAITEDEYQRRRRDIVDSL